MDAVQVGVLWQHSSVMDLTSLVSSGLEAVFCDEDASLDADCDCGDGGSVLFDPVSVSEVLVLFLMDVLEPVLLVGMIGVEKTEAHSHENQFATKSLE